MANTPANSIKRDKILIIEGHVAFGQQLAVLLTKEGYETILVRNGVEAMKMIYDVLPRLIILDAVLPESDSYHILESKNAEPLLKNIPVFFISTQGTPINMHNIKQGSVAEFIILFHMDPTAVVTKVKAFMNPTAQRSIDMEVKSKIDSKKKLLWIEDDKLITNILGKKFISSGFDLQHAGNGEEAMKILGTFTPDVIVLDLLLPGISGLDLLQKLTMNAQLKNVPVIILSNLDKQRDMEKAKMLGVKRYLVKAGTSLDKVVEEIRGVCK